jgi:hypothetical protein
MAARDRARSAASVAGRGPLLREAVAAARDATIRAFARGGFSGTWAATDMAVSVVRAEDRVAAASALEEATMAEVVDDLVDEDTLDVLRSTLDELVSLRGIPSPGSLATFAAPVGAAIRGPLQVSIIGAFVVLSAIIAIEVGAASGLVVVALGVAIVAVTARHYGWPRS